ARRSRALPGNALREALRPVLVPLPLPVAGARQSLANPRDRAEPGHEGMVAEVVATRPHLLLALIDLIACLAALLRLLFLSELLATAFRSPIALLAPGPIAARPFAAPIFTSSDLSSLSSLTKSGTAFSLGSSHWPRACAAAARTPASLSSSAL